MKQKTFLLAILSVGLTITGYAQHENKATIQTNAPDVSKAVSMGVTQAALKAGNHPSLAIENSDLKKLQLLAATQPPTKSVGKAQTAQPSYKAISSKEASLLYRATSK